MQILGSIFNIIIFVSAIGSIFTVLSFFAYHILRCTLPLWFSFCGMILFCFPFLSPDVFLIPPKEQDWLKGFQIACLIWVCGCGILLVWDTVRLMLAGRAVKSCRICSNGRLNRIYSQCTKAFKLKEAPVLYQGTLNDPIFVAGVIRPAVILNERITEQLTDTELSAVFFHELCHVKCRHLLLKRIYDYVCILNWMNPFSWIAMKNFSFHCEIACDRSALKMLQGKVTKTEYASAVIRLLELSTAHAAKPKNGIGALDFLLTKGRIKRITARTSKVRNRVTTILLAMLLIFTLAFSMRLSREYFYPYPANNMGTEYRAGYHK